MPPREGYKSYSFRSDRGRKIAAAARAVARARQILGRRGGSTLRAPLRSGGYFGTRRIAKELKVIDTTGATLADSSGDLILLSGVAAGTDFTDRIGRKIFLKSISLRFSMVPGTASTNQGDVVRVMLIYDTQTNGAAPATTDILTTASQLSHMNLNNRDRFRVLMDKNLTMGASIYAASALTQGAPVPRFFHMYRKIALEEIFQGTANTVGSIATGAIWLLIIGIQDDLTQTYYNARIRFEDA